VIRNIKLNTHIFRYLHSILGGDSFGIGVPAITLPTERNSAKPPRSSDSGVRTDHLQYGNSRLTPSRIQRKELMALRSSKPSISSAHKILLHYVQALSNGMGSGRTSSFFALENLSRVSLRVSNESYHD